MGFWQTERGTGGDSWADALDDCMKQLSKIKFGKHEMTMVEFADLVEFCSRGHLSVVVRYPNQDGDRPLSKLHDKGVATYPNRGQIHCPTICETK